MKLEISIEWVRVDHGQVSGFVLRWRRRRDTLGHSVDKIAMKGVYEEVQSERSPTQETMVLIQWEEKQLRLWPQSSIKESFELMKDSLPTKGLRP